MAEIKRFYNGKIHKKVYPENVNEIMGKCFFSDLEGVKKLEKKQPFVTDKCRYTALQLACQTRTPNLDLIKYLLKKKVPFRKDNITPSALDYAIVFNPIYVKILLKHGAEVSENINFDSLSLAYDHNPILIPILLQYGANPNFSIANEPILLRALEDNNLLLGKLLINHGAIFTKYIVRSLMYNKDFKYLFLIKDSPFFYNIERMSYDKKSKFYTFPIWKEEHLRGIPRKYNDVFFYLKTYLKNTVKIKSFDEQEGFFSSNPAVFDKYYCKPEHLYVHGKLFQKYLALSEKKRNEE